MNSMAVHTGFYGEKAEMIIAICNRFFSGSLPVSRNDIYDDTRSDFLMEEEYSIMSEDESSSSSLRKLFMMFPKKNSFFCIERDAFGEVCLKSKKLLNATKATTDNIMLNLYGELQDSIPQIMQLLIKYDAPDGGLAFKRAATFKMEYYGEKFSTGNVKLKESTVKLSVMDCHVMLDVVNVRKNALLKDEAVNPKKYAYSKDDMDKVAGKSEEDPFLLAQRELLINEEEKTLKDFVESSKEAFLEYEERMKQVKNDIIKKLKEKFNFKF